MMTWTISSQDLRTKQVKVATLKKIKAKIDKCDSLKVAYISINKTLDSLVVSNNKMFLDFETERKKKESYQTDLNAKEKELNKILQKPNKGWVVPVAVGLLAGVVLTSF